MKKSIKTLDLSPMPPYERHSRIFEAWNSLKEGETLKIINDHEPKPLYYQFEAEHKGQFEWNYEKQGPKNWVFTIKKVSDKKEASKFLRNEFSKEFDTEIKFHTLSTEIKSLIKQLKTKKDASRLKEKAKNILKNVSPRDLGLIEQEMIKEGTTRKEMRKLCDVHLEVMKESMGKPEMNLKPGHPVHTLMEEHKMILDFVDNLQKTIEKIRCAKDFDEIPRELETLRHISEHLVEADKHHQREEDVLFPAMEKYGVTEPPIIMREEHIVLKAQKKALYNATRKKMPYSEFAKKVSKASEFIIQELPDHIYKEDNILYPMALEVIPKAEWPGIKKKCDSIGYCCFTPGH